MKNIKKRHSIQLFLLYISILSYCPAYSQNSIGAANSNYTPTNSVVLNPANMANAKTFLDINIVGFGSYVNNNFVFVSDNNIIQVLRGGYDVNVFYDKQRKPIRAFNHNFIAGPGATWNKGDHAIGLAINARSYTGVQDLPSYARPFIEYGVPSYTFQHNIDYTSEKIRIASLHFAEIKASYAYTFLKDQKNLFTGGISLKKMMSIAGGAANIYNASFDVRNDSIISLFNLNADAMYTPNPKLNGKGGIGLDIGITFQKMLRECGAYLPHTSKSGCRYVPYKYRAGFSMIDIGSLKFNEDSIRFAGYNFSNYEWLHYTDIDENNPINTFSNQESDITSGTVKKPNKIKLPTFICAQFDYNIWASALYINATLIQGIPHGQKSFGIRHANSLSISPRYETKLIDVCIPFSLYEYKSPQLGLSIRVGPITIGSDKFVNWIFNTDIYGGDIYFYAKVPIHYHPKCKVIMRKRDLSRKGKTGKSKIDCSY